MNILHTEIEIGAERPFTVIHASDTHLTYADMRDGERKVRLAERRRGVFPDAEAAFGELIKLRSETGAMLVHTGDLIDFVSKANLEKAKEFTKKTGCFFAAGNHEFSLFVGEAKEDEAYRNQSLAAVCASFGCDVRFSARTVNGVNFVAVDNSYYLFDRQQLDSLKAEVSKGLPVVLCLHTPLYSPELYGFLKEGKEKTEPAYLMSVPEERMRDYSPERYAQQKEDAVTREAYEYIVSEERIKALLTGHVHRPFAFALGDKMQYGVGCTDVRITRFR